MSPVLPIPPKLPPAAAPATLAKPQQMPKRPTTTQVVMRAEEALDRLARWGKRSRTLFKKRSSGATTAKAVGVFAAADKEIRKVTGGKRSLDQVAAILAKDRGEVSIERLAAAAEKVAGQPVKALDRKRLGAD
jgi:hypothetical protein